VALPLPFELKKASLQEIKQIPGLSRKAGEIMASRGENTLALSQSPVFEAIKRHIK
jgi:radical SAM superfamily enzyme with C-terminal helix-hairpin-helix motif